MRRDYFNLHELGLVTAVAVLLLVGLVVLIPLYVRFRTRESRRRVTCHENLEAIGRALATYSDRYDGWYPAVNPPGRNLEPLNSLGILPDSQDYGCPSMWRTLPGRSKVAANSDYWYAGSGLQRPAPADSRLAYDRSGNHPDNAWMNCLFVDGHVEGTKPDGSRTWNRY